MFILLAVLLAILDRAVGLHLLNLFVNKSRIILVLIGDVSQNF